MKKVFLIFICILLIITMSGCKRRVDPNRLQYWTSGTGPCFLIEELIYEIDSEPTKIIKGEKYWDRENAILNIKFGWNDRIGKPDFEGNDNCILITFGIYLLYEKNNYDDYIYDDYHNHEDGFLIGKIEKEEFLSEKYRVTLDNKAKFFGFRPKFNIENEGFKLKINSELIKKINKENSENIKFKFIVVPVYLDVNTGKFNLSYIDTENELQIFIYNKTENMIEIYAS